ncbi:MAG: ferredoxin [Alphaproteobacteria bacterium]|nr:ferredoxin [Alphaproteobacteria bacterium]MBM3653045.1 ferredoxin [Alphaproteobacteria bacterium]
MSTITIMPSGKTVEASEGTTLLTAIRSADEKLLPDFDATMNDLSPWHIFVHEGRKGLSKTSREENEKLDAIVGVGSKSRLACFATVLGTENIKVELLGFGSGM